MTTLTKENTKLNWHTEQRKVSDLIPNSDNPRKMSEKQAEELKKSVEKFNLAEIPAIERSMALYNELITEFAERKDARKLLRPFTEDLQSFLLKNEAPDPKAVTELAEAIKHYAELELNSRN